VFATGVLPDGEWHNVCMTMDAVPNPNAPQRKDADLEAFGVAAPNPVGKQTAATDANLSKPLAEPATGPHERSHVLTSSWLMAHFISLQCPPYVFTSTGLSNALSPYRSLACIS